MALIYPIPSFFGGLRGLLHNLGSHGDTVKLQQPFPRACPASVLQSCSQCSPQTPRHCSEFVRGRLEYGPQAVWGNGLHWVHLKILELLGVSLAPPARGLSRSGKASCFSYISAFYLLWPWMLSNNYEQPWSASPHHQNHFAPPRSAQEQWQMRTTA